MGDNDIESFRLYGVSGGFLGDNFPTGGGSAFRTDTGREITANFGIREAVMAFLSG
jgi:hypothetical protein